MKSLVLIESIRGFAGIVMARKMYFEPQMNTDEHGLDLCSSVLDLKLVKWEKTEETVEAVHAPATIS